MLTFIADFDEQHMYASPGELVQSNLYGCGGLGSNPAYKGKHCYTCTPRLSESIILFFMDFNTQNQLSCVVGLKNLWRAAARIHAMTTVITKKVHVIKCQYLGAI